jgi:predicted DNA-binding protein
MNNTVKDKYKSPGRARYEQSHPVISARVSKELYDKLKEIKGETGKSFADILKEGLEGLGIQEAKTEKAYKEEDTIKIREGKKNTSSGLDIAKGTENSSMAT